LSSILTRVYVEEGSFGVRAGANFGQFFPTQEPIPGPGQLKIADRARVQRGGDEAAAD